MKSDRNKQWKDLFTKKLDDNLILKTELINELEDVVKKQERKEKLNRINEIRN